MLIAAFDTTETANVVTDGICIEDCGTQISRPFISVCREVDLIAYFIKLRYNHKIIWRNNNLENCKFLLLLFICIINANVFCPVFNNVEVAAPVIHRR